MSYKISAAILAGGKATRLQGIHKDELRTPDGIPVIKKLIQTLHRADIPDVVLLSSPECAQKFHIKAIPDLRKHIGPLAGVEAGLTYFKDQADAVLFLPCDMPNISIEEINQLKRSFSSQKTSVVYTKTTEKHHPLFAIVSVSTLPLITQLIDKGERKVSTVWKHLNGEALHFKNSAAFININTPEDLNEWLKEAN